MKSRLRLMLNSYPHLQFRCLSLAVVVFGSMLTARAAQTPADSKAAGVAAKSPAAAVPAEPEIPKSIFHIPASPQDPVKDPFFPQSTRLRNKPQLIVSSNAPPVVVELELKGISGGAERRLAIINSRTFAVGEEGDVPTSSGKAHIRVLEIKSDSVVVLLNGEQRVLRLRAGI